MKINFNAARQLTPELQRGVQINYAPAKRAAFRLRWWLLLAMILSPIVLLIWYLIGDKIYVLAPGIITTEPMEIRSSGSGIIRHILVSPGENVKVGQTLAELHDPVLEARINTIRKQQAELEDRSDEPLDKVVLKPLQDALVDAKMNLEKSNYQSWKNSRKLPLKEFCPRQTWLL